MNIQQNVSLSRYSTMKLGGQARYLTEVNNKKELLEGLAYAKDNNLEIVMIGVGSNIVWSDEGFDGLVMVNKLSNFDVKEIEGSAIFTVGAGNNWDETVKKSVDMGYSGLEQLSLIPGTVGATPVQNVGAYGQEIKDVLVSVDAYDMQKKDFVTIDSKDCGFGYRTSRFKTTDKGRFFITSISMKLAKQNPRPPFYESLQKYFDSKNIATFTPKIVRNAVIAVRKDKLPDPSVVANNGSFFANPIINAAEFAALEIKYPSIYHWKMPDNKVKISAAWLVEQAGFGKGYEDTETGMATWKNHSLVIVNKRAKKTDDLLKFKEKISQAVHAKFGITIEQEPELI